MFWNKQKKGSGYEPGITLRSVAASLLCIALAAVYTNYSCAFLNEHRQIVNQAIPIPAMLAVLFSTLMVGVMALLARRRIFTRAELVCIAFATMMAAPLMSDGLWQRFFGIITSVPRAGAFDYIDVYDDGLWPHGCNILAGSFNEASSGHNAAPGPKQGAFTNITWDVVEYEDGVEGRCPTISNASAADETWLEFDVPVRLGDGQSMTPSHPHLVSVLGYIENGEMSSGSLSSAGRAVFIGPPVFLYSPLP